MYIYYNLKGILKELINDSSLRQYDQNVNDLYWYWEGDHAVTSIWLTYLLKDELGNETQQIQKLTSDFVVEGTLPYDKTRNLEHFTYGQTYKFYHAVIPNEILQNKGLVSCMIQMYQEDTATTLGLLVFNVDTGLKITTDINTSEWEYLKNLVSQLAESSVQSVAGLTGVVSAEDLSTALIATGKFATDLSGYLQKVTSTTTNKQLYTKEANGSQSMSDISSTPKANAILLMDANGKLHVLDGTESDNPISLSQANDTYVSIVKTATNKIIVYGRGANNRETYYELALASTPQTIPLRDDKGSIRVSTPLTDTSAANKKYVDDLVKSINSINVLNKNAEAINATSATVQTVATNYVTTNYGRQPQTYDGLIITMTDQSNDKILWMFTETSGMWINVGSDPSEIDLSNYPTIDEATTIAEAEALKKAGYEYLLGFTGTKQNGNIAFTLDTSLSDFVIKNSTAYAISLAYTGDLTKTDTITLIDKDGHTINLNCIKKPSVTTTSTIEDFAQVHRIDSNNIHRWEFRARYSEQTQGGTLYRNFYTDSITNAVDVQYVTLTSDSGSGTLTDEQLATLQASKENKIIYDNEVYILAGNNHTTGYLVYSCLDAENNTNVAKTITITISVKSWLMASHNIIYTAGNGIKIENNKISLDVGNAETTSF